MPQTPDAPTSELEQTIEGRRLADPRLAALGPVSRRASMGHGA